MCVHTQWVHRLSHLTSPHVFFPVIKLLQPRLDPEGNFNTLRSLGLGWEVGEGKAVESKCFSQQDPPMMLFFVKLRFQSTSHEHLLRVLCSVAQFDLIGHILEERKLSLPSEKSLLPHTVSLTSHCDKISKACLINNSCVSLWKKKKVRIPTTEWKPHLPNSHLRSFNKKINK